MICEVVGKMKRSYEMTDEKTGRTRSGISCRLSLHVGTYENNPSEEISGEGEQFAELRCPESIHDAISLGDIIHAELDDKKTRIKSAMLQVDKNSFIPIE